VDELTADVEGALAAVADRAGAVDGGELAIRRQLLRDATTISFEEALGGHLAACDRMLRRSAAQDAA
jgi:isomerase DpgB